MWKVECFVSFVNFASYAYVIEESAGLIADEWQTFFVVVSMLHFEFGSVVGFLLVEAADIRFEICSLDGCECAEMSVEIVTHFADNVGLCYFDTLSLYRTNFDSEVVSDGEHYIHSTWMNDYFVGVLCANDYLTMAPDDVVKSDALAGGGQFFQFVRNLKLCYYIGVCFGRLVSGEHSHQ